MFIRRWLITLVVICALGIALHSQVGYPGISINTNINPLTAQPLDTRDTIAVLSDTTTLLTFRYEGQMVYAYDTQEYWYFNGVAWTLFSSGGDGYIMTDLLAGNTTYEATGDFNIDFSGQGNFDLDSLAYFFVTPRANQGGNDGYIYLGRSDDHNLQIFTDGAGTGYSQLGNTSNYVLIQDNNAQLYIGAGSSSFQVFDDRVSPAGLEYDDNYHGTYTNRSLVDKEYVDGLIGGGGTNIYTTSDTLTSNRIVTGLGYDLTFDTVANFVVNSYNSGGIVTYDADTTYALSITTSQGVQLLASEGGSSFADISITTSGITFSSDQSTLNMFVPGLPAGSQDSVLVVDANNQIYKMAASDLPGGGGGGITAINSETGTSQTIAVDTTGTGFVSISSASNIHTINFAHATQFNKGIVSTDAQSFAGPKAFINSVELNHDLIDFTGSAGTSGYVVSSNGGGGSGVVWISPGSMVVTNPLGTNTIQDAINDLNANLFGGAMNDLTDATITSLTDGEILVSSGGIWINNTLDESGITGAISDSLATLSSITIGNTEVAHGDASGNIVGNSNFTYNSSLQTFDLLLVNGADAVNLDMDADSILLLASSASGYVTIRNDASSIRIYGDEGGFFSYILPTNSPSIGEVMADLDGDGILDFEAIGVLPVTNPLGTNTLQDAINDLNSNLFGGAMNDLTDATITSLTDGEILVSSGGVWVNNTLNESGITGAISDSIGIHTLNGLSSRTQYLIVDTAGIAPSWQSVADTHRLNLPFADDGVYGIVSASLQQIDGHKIFLERVGIGTQSPDSIMLFVQGELYVQNEIYDAFRSKGMQGDVLISDSTNNRTVWTNIYDLDIPNPYGTADKLGVYLDSLFSNAGAGGGGGGIANLNGETGAAQTFATGTAGTNFNILSSGNTHTFNIPNASGLATGLLTNGGQTIGGDKFFNNSVSFYDDVYDADESAGVAGYVFTSQGGGNTGTLWQSPGVLIVTNPTGGVNNLQNSLDDIWSNSSDNQTVDTLSFDINTGNLSMTLRDDGADPYILNLDELQKWNYFGYSDNSLISTNTDHYFLVTAVTVDISDTVTIVVDSTTAFLESGMEWKWKTAINKESIKIFMEGNKYQFFDSYDRYTGTGKDTLWLASNTQEVQCIFDGTRILYTVIAHPDQDPITTEVSDATVTALIGRDIPINMGGTSTTVEPPSNPRPGQWFGIFDSRGDATTSIIIEVDFVSAGQKLNGTLENYHLRTKAKYAKFVYDSVAVGWMVKD
jgi:hypothetical protein